MSSSETETSAVSSPSPPPTKRTTRRSTSETATAARRRSTTNTPKSQDIITKEKLRELLHQIDPDERFDLDVEELLVELTKEFVTTTTEYACKLAQLRDGPELEVRDVAMQLEKEHNIVIPGFDLDNNDVKVEGLKEKRQNPSLKQHMSKMSAIGNVGKKKK